MKNENEIEKELARLKADERLSYPSANVFINAPLALIQQDLESRVAILQWVLEGDGAVEQKMHPTTKAGASKSDNESNPAASGG